LPVRSFSWPERTHSMYQREHILHTKENTFCIPERNHSMYQREPILYTRENTSMHQREHILYIHLFQLCLKSFKLPAEHFRCIYQREHILYTHLFGKRCSAVFSLLPLALKFALLLYSRSLLTL
jgi:hypothetical protein